MRTFDFDADRYAADFAARGYVHIPNGVDPGFLAYARETAERLLGQPQDQLQQFRIAGKKLQFLFEFPTDEALDDAFRQVAVISAMPNARLTLCERHLKAYEEAAAADPAPHKDRVASQVAVGIPLIVPEGSYLALYPDRELEINPLESTALWRSSLDPEQLPERVLHGVEPVSIDAQPGDVVIFRGSSIYHERMQAAGSVVLYLKFNGLRLDPLAEDPGTLSLIERSREVVEKSSDHGLLDRRVEVSPRLLDISRHYTRLYWKQVIQARVGGQSGAVTLSELELELVRNIHDVSPVREVMRRLGIPEPCHHGSVPLFRRLARRGVILFH